MNEIFFSGLFFGFIHEIHENESIHVQSYSKIWNDCAIILTITRLCNPSTVEKSKSAQFISSSLFFWSSLSGLSSRPRINPNRGRALKRENNLSMQPQKCIIGHILISVSAPPPQHYLHILSISIPIHAPSLQTLNKTDAVYSIEQVIGIFLV